MRGARAAAGTGASPRLGQGPRLRVGLALFFTLALLLRLAVVLERSVNDPLFWRQVEGGDDYFEAAAEMLATGVNPMGDYYQPGAVYYFYLWQRLLGTNRLTVRLGLALAGAGQCAWLGLAAWWAAGNERAGLITAALAALYPTLIFYEQAFVTAPAAISAAVAFLVCALGALRARRTAAQALWSLLAGLAVGAGGIARIPTLALAPALPAALLVAGPWRAHWKKAALLGAVICAGAALVVLVGSWLNSPAGELVLIMNHPSDVK